MAAGLACAQAETGPATAGPVVSLPTFTVTDTRLLPPPESWRYASVPGFEVLSNASNGTTEEMVHYFLQFHRAVETIWPTSRMNAEVAASLILCKKADTFAEFVPTNVLPNVASTLSLSIQDRENAAIVINLQSSGPLETGGLSDYSKGLLHDEYVHFLVARVGPRTPPWLDAALVKLFGGMGFDKNQIVLPAIEVPDLPARKAFGAAKPPARLADNAAYQTAIRAGSFMTFARLFAPDSAPADAGEGSDNPWSKESYEFVHFCLFGGDRKYQLPFLNFAYFASREPVTEELFRRFFKKGYDEVESELWGYTDFASDKGFKLEDKDGKPLKDVPKLPLKEASEAESGRVRGEAQRMSGRTEEARRSLIAPYFRGSRDPQLLAALGLAELAAGRDERALRFLEAATTGKTTRARAYVELARLILKGNLARPGGPGGRLAVDQVTDVLLKLFAARPLPPHLPDLYELIAETWSHSLIKPTSGHLAAIDEGVRLFPYDMNLVFADATLQAQLGTRQAAVNLCDIGLEYAPDPATRERFLGLKASLPLEGSH